MAYRDSPAGRRGWICRLAGRNCRAAVRSALRRRAPRRLVTDKFAVF